jgi:Arc/MetJ-type ribon-helix-helix transcriptional regulator
MRRTTIYLPDELKARVERVARDRNRSEADVIREALERFTANEGRPRPRLPLFESGQPDLARSVDDALAGFGER